ncbi:MAG: TraB/GumN family protein [Candidatus Thermoplasmatota archaeon]|jgi:pheromone shutdown protein TraB|nr:TraB/GumN family protein [Candidatus Thermoplasmatota archaeon]MDP7264009.1 TraB/GumN family protein [Candidatus Thermoplasmatota archaeon]
MLRKIDDDITLIGTAHISEKSAREVEKAISEIRPHIVAVELDTKRYLAITRQQRWEKTSLIKVIRSGRASLMLVQIILGTIQKKLGLKEKIRPGAEMIAAIKVARKNDIPVALVDRDIAVTFKRGWQCMGFFEKFRLFRYGLMAIFGGSDEELDKVAIEEMMKDDVITVMIAELKDVAPGIGKAFIDERDTFIALKLMALRDETEKPMKHTGRKLTVLKDRKKDRILTERRKEKAANLNKKNDEKRKNPRKVLGVVGAGHLNGIEKNVKKYEDKSRSAELNKLSKFKKKSISVGKCLGYAIPLLLLFLVGYLIYQGDYSKLGYVFLWWFIINGVCSALGALAARGHFLSVITAFAAAPLTSLNPLLAAGWFAGMVEAYIRTPRVADLEELASFERFRDFFNNRLVRVLMVAAFANIGSVVGTYLAAAKIIQMML